MESERIVCPRKKLEDLLIWLRNSVDVTEIESVDFSKSFRDILKQNAVHTKDQFSTRPNWASCSYPLFSVYFFLTSANPRKACPRLIYLWIGEESDSLICGDMDSSLSAIKEIGTSKK